MCQNAYGDCYSPELYTHADHYTVNSLSDFCVFGPPEPGPDSVIGNIEANRWYIFQMIFGSLSSSRM